jgi:ferritin-like metal-binding protein YciE
MKEFKGAPALDAGLLAAAQAVEHYEIARYGTLKTWAKELGLHQAVKLLEATLAEEKKTDEALTGPRAARGKPARASSVRQEWKCQAITLIARGGEEAQAR